MKFIFDLISGSLPFCFLIITGLFLTLKTKACQISRFKESIILTKNAFKAKESAKGITSFKAACTALSATVGTGNIAGVAGAISIGGAGAVFWMWVSAVLGMVIKAAEIALSITYREKNEKGFVGGPMYYIKNGLGKAFLPLSFVFCLAAIPAVFCSGNLTQTNAAITSFCSGNLSRLIWGIIFSVGCLIALMGGIERIAEITEKIVPMMSVLYVILALWVLYFNLEKIPVCFQMIIKGAFNPKAVTSGAVGSAFTCAFIGASRGIFSNEAGLGTSAMAHSVAIDANPKTQGLYGIFEVFIDTIVLCTLTALTILCSGVKINYGAAASTELVANALHSVCGNFGNIALSTMMCLFAFSSIIGWAVYGRLCVGFIFGEKANIIFNLLYPLSCILGAVLDSRLAWQLASLCNGIMLCINLLAVLLLSENAIKYLKRGKNFEQDKSIKKNFKGKHRRSYNL